MNTTCSGGNIFYFSPSSLIQVFRKNTTTNSYYLVQYQITGLCNGDAVFFLIGADKFFFNVIRKTFIVVKRGGVPT